MTTIFSVNYITILIYGISSFFNLKAILHFPFEHCVHLVMYSCRLLVISFLHSRPQNILQVIFAIQCSEMSIETSLHSGVCLIYFFLSMNSSNNVIARFLKFWIHPRKNHPKYATDSRYHHLRSEKTCRVVRQSTGQLSPYYSSYEYSDDFIIILRPLLAIVLIIIFSLVCPTIHSFDIKL